MQKLTLAIIFGLISISLSAGTPGKNEGEKPTGALQGWVIDEMSAEALTGATIKIVELDIVAYASFDGSYEIPNLPEGTYTVEVSSLSYEKQTVKDVVVKADGSSKKFYLSSF